MKCSLGRTEGIGARWSQRRLERYCLRCVLWQPPPSWPQGFRRCIGLVALPRSSCFAILVTHECRGPGIIRSPVGDYTLKMLHYLTASEVCCLRGQVCFSLEGGKGQAQAFGAGGACGLRTAEWGFQPQESGHNEAGSRWTAFLLWGIHCLFLAHH